MSRPVFPRLALVASLLAGAACSDSTGPGGDGPDPAVLAGLIAGAGGSGVSGTSACPAGGDVLHDFDASLTVNGDILNATIEATIEFRDCAHPLQGKTVTIDGSSQLDAQHTLRIREGSAPELIEGRSHQVGTHRWYGDGFDRTCSFDLRTVTIPAQGIRELSGTMCGRPIRFRLPDLAP